jgi:hypothetical protein
MKPVINLFFLVGLVLLVAGCDRSGSGERGHFEIRNVEVEQRDPGVYEVTFDAVWEGDLSVQESSCMVQVMGTDTPLATGRAKITDSGTDLTTSLKGDEGAPERADVLCPEVSVIDLNG